MIFAEFRRNPLEAQPFVDLLFACTQDFFAARAGQRVLGEREAALERDLAQVDVVLLRAGGVLQGGPEAFGRVNPDLRTHAAREFD
ncbi:MAG: hypothetical protein NTY23_02055 [Chloroflexi bacterium]|nr:hypothetical protein [Chloroflexota bacterium]